MRDYKRFSVRKRSALARLPGAFTLVEMMVSLAVLTIMMLVLAQITSSTSKIWQGTNDKISAFQNARAAFETMTQTLSQATLNTYYDYFDSNGARNTPAMSAAAAALYTPSMYDRYSELHFISGPAKTLLQGVTRIDSTGSSSYPAITSGHAIFFQAPLGYTKENDAKNLDNTLNAVGYFVEFGTDKDFMPPLISSKVSPRYRYRLVQLMQPAEKLSVYSENWGSRTKGTKANWFKTPMDLQIAAADPRPTQILADNIIMMIIRPKYSDLEYANASPKPTPIASNYIYDSQPKAVIPPAQIPTYPTRYQLPPLVGVTLVAIDETSAIRLQDKYQTKAPLVEWGLTTLFQTTADTNLPADYEKDLETLKDKLVAEKVNYRIFDTELIIRSSKWTQN
jgi:uncharacterized protein (TIGR02599 family)